MRLSNIQTIDQMKEFILPSMKYERLPGNIFECFRFEKFMEQLDNSLINSSRMEQKSLVFILGLHKELEEQFTKIN